MRLIKKENIKDNLNYYDLSIPETHNYILENGIIVHNCGTGVGFSVEKKYVNQLPTINSKMYSTNTTIVVEDSKIGWASSYREMLALLWTGKIPKWDVSKIRPAGARLITFGGRASGPEPLEGLFKFTVALFKNAAGRKLTTLECHDLVCKIADIVVVGGVRRSALISLSDLEDLRMRDAKSGEWWKTNGQRRLANNSAVYTEKPPIGVFMDEWLSVFKSNSGERGIINQVASTKQAGKNGRRKIQNEDKTIISFGTNPCGEIILRNSEHCNLSEVIIRPDDTFETLSAKVINATILGTLQSTLTDFRYLSDDWEKNTKEEHLLGVSLTGIMEHPFFSGKSKIMYDAPNTCYGKQSSGFDDPTECKLPEVLQALKQIAIDTNKLWAETLGINSSVAITCIKPSGCVSLDTRIKSNVGLISMLGLFTLCGYEYETLINYPNDTWLELNKNISVWDENNKEQQITKLYINGFQELFELEFEDGNLYKFTGNHKLKTNDGFKRVDELTIDDEIISF
jgi:ribonucleoside-diphosphate reductase alpha chain